MTSLPPNPPARQSHLITSSTLLIPKLFMPVSSEPAPLPWNYISKLVCIGDSGCGKSSLTIRLCEGRFVNSHDVTIGVEFGSRIVPVGPPANAALHINDPSSAPPNGRTSGTTSPGTQRKVKGDQEQKKMKVGRFYLMDCVHTGQAHFESSAQSLGHRWPGDLQVHHQIILPRRVWRIASLRHHAALDFRVSNRVAA